MRFPVRVDLQPRSFRNECARLLFSALRFDGLERILLGVALIDAPAEECPPELQVTVERPFGDMFRVLRFLLAYVLPGTLTAPDPVQELHGHHLREQRTVTLRVVRIEPFPEATGERPVTGERAARQRTLFLPHVLVDNLTYRHVLARVLHLAHRTPAVGKPDVQVADHTLTVRFEFGQVLIPLPDAVHLHRPALHLAGQAVQEIILDDIPVSSVPT